MNRNKTDSFYQENSSDVVYEAFREFDTEYARLKQMIACELRDYQDMLNREKKQTALYKNKVQTRDVMEAALPILSEIRNDVLDSEDLDELKKIVQTRYKQLFAALSQVGVQIKLHERNQPIGMNEKVNGSVKATTDPNLHQKVAISNQMGCVIRGEEDNPILEDVEIYSYDEGSANRRKGKDARRETVDLRNQERDVKADVLVRQGQIVEFLSPLVLTTPYIMIQLFPTGSQMIPGAFFKPVLSGRRGSLQQCRISLGSKVLAEMSLENMQLLYGVVYDQATDTLFLNFLHEETKELLLQYPLTVIDTKEG